jgi:hypothetical protein
LKDWTSFSSFWRWRIALANIGPIPLVRSL